MIGEFIPATAAKTRSEQRRQERYDLDRDPAGELHLRNEGERCRVRAIKDVSSSGICIYLDLDVAVPSKVAIEYLGPDEKLEVYGTTVWCTRSGAVAGSANKPPRGEFVTGIELSSPLLLLTCLQQR